MEEICDPGHKTRPFWVGNSATIREGIVHMLDSRPFGDDDDLRDYIVTARLLFSNIYNEVCV